MSGVADGPPNPDADGRSADLSRRIFATVVVVTALLFAWQVRRYRFVGDDAFISFRYARHLADGHGLVWNPGERVEGYTNFLWVLMMAGAIQLGIAPEQASMALGMAAGAGVLVLTWTLAVRLSPRPTPLVLLAPLLLTLSRTFTSWVTGGLETMWFTLLVTGALFAAVEERRRDVRRPIGSASLLALASLTRPEGVLFAGVVGAWMAIDAAKQSGRRRPFVLWTSIVGVVVGAHLLWRHDYYGEWLPNTFAAKVPAAWWDQGLTYAWLFTRAYGLPAFLPLVAWALRRRPDRDRALVAASVAVYALYVIAVGGDRFEFRFWVPVLPLTYWLVADSTVRLEFPRAGTAVVVAALIAATVHGSWEDDDEQFPPRHGIEPLSVVRGYATRRIAEGKRLRALIDSGVLDRGLVLAVTGAGAVPYYADWPTVDRVGLSDKYVAHLPVPVRGFIAHEHMAPKEYLARRRVVIDDVLNQLVFPKKDGMSAIYERSADAPLYVADVGDAWVVFGSFVPDAEVRRAFARASSLTVLPAGDGK
jgi:hypothetical protein